MANEKISEVIEYLASSVKNNEVTNVDQLTMAIDELDHFPMTFDILDTSRVGQILQSIRHSNEISIFIKERIRSLIKCWRLLLNVDTFSVIPIEIKSKMSKTPAVKNGYINGFIPDDKPVNGVNNKKSKIEENVQQFKESITNNAHMNSIASKNDQTIVDISNNCVAINNNYDKPICAVNSNSNIERDFTETHIDGNFKDKISINNSCDKKEDVIEKTCTDVTTINCSINNIDECINGDKCTFNESINSNTCIFDESINSKVDKADESINSNNCKVDESINSNNCKVDESLNSNNCKVNESMTSEIDESINSNTCKFDESKNSNTCKIDESINDSTFKIDESKNIKLDEPVDRYCTEFEITSKNKIDEPTKISVTSVDTSNEERSVNDEPSNEIPKYERRSSILKINLNKESNTYSISENETTIRSRNISNSSKVNETVSSQNESQSNLMSGKPKVKSTKELLADFSNFIEADIKNKILMDKISQEDDEPISYFPTDAKVKELVQMSLLQEKYNNKTRQQTMPLRRRRTESVKSSEPEEVYETNPKCEMLLKMFNEQCTKRPQVVLKHFVPWPNMKRGLQMHAPEIKQPLSKRRRMESAEVSEIQKPAIDPVSLNVINNLLESFEVRAQQKQMISDAIQQRKEQTKIIDNTLSLVDMSLKLKLKIPKVPTIKIRRKKKTRKKKKLKIKPIKVRVKKPRKPYVRPMPPITNYLDDIPVLPPLPDNIPQTPLSDDNVREGVEYCEENITKLVYGVMEGYNCTKNAQTGQIYQLTSMYSDIINKHYLHVFPWVDLQYPAKSTFPTDSNQMLQSIIDIQSFYS